MALLNLCGWCSYSKELPCLSSCYLALKTKISDDVVWNSATEWNADNPFAALMAACEVAVLQQSLLEVSITFESLLSSPNRSDATLATPHCYQIWDLLKHSTPICNQWSTSFWLTMSDYLNSAASHSAPNDLHYPLNILVLTYRRQRTVFLWSRVQHSPN